MDPSDSAVLTTPLQMRRRHVHYTLSLACTVALKGPLPVTGNGMSVVWVFLPDSISPLLPLSESIPKS